MINTALAMSFGERAAYAGKVFLIGVMTVFAALVVLWLVLVLFRKFVAYFNGEDLEAAQKAYGARYTVNGSEPIQTSYQFTNEELALARENEETMSAYMFGIQIELKAGVNTIKIEGATDTEYNQLFRAFYFAKTANVGN